MIWLSALRIRGTLGVFLLLWLSVLAVTAATKPDHAERIASLIDPAKLATLRPRGAIPRVQKIVYQLEIARRERVQIGPVVDVALRKAGVTNRLVAQLTKDTMLRNLNIASRLGCLTDEGLDEMKQGKSPTITVGPYTGDQLSVDHIVPLDVAPELDHVIANVELMPARMNSSKKDKVGARQRDFAMKFYGAGLLSPEGHRAVIDGARKVADSR